MWVARSLALLEDANGIHWLPEPFRGEYKEQESVLWSMAYHFEMSSVCKQKSGPAWYPGSSLVKQYTYLAPFKYPCNFSRMIGFRSRTTIFRLDWVKRDRREAVGKSWSQRCSAPAPSNPCNILARRSWTSEAEILTAEREASSKRGTMDFGKSHTIILVGASSLCSRIFYRRIIEN